MQKSKKLYKKSENIHIKRLELDSIVKNVNTQKKKYICSFIKKKKLLFYQYRF